MGKGGMHPCMLCWFLRMHHANWLLRVPNSIGSAYLIIYTFCRLIVDVSFAPLHASAHRSGGGDGMYRCICPTVWLLQPSMTTTTYDIPWVTAPTAATMTKINLAHYTWRPHDDEQPRTADGDSSNIVGGGNSDKTTAHGRPTPPPASAAVKDLHVLYTPYSDVYIKPIMELYVCVYVHANACITTSQWICLFKFFWLVYATAWRICT